MKPENSEKSPTLSRIATASLSVLPGNLIRVLSRADNACSVRSILRSNDVIATGRRWVTPRGVSNAATEWGRVGECLVSTVRVLLETKKTS